MQVKHCDSEQKKGNIRVLHREAIHCSLEKVSLEMQHQTPPTACFDGYACFLLEVLWIHLMQSVQLLPLLSILIVAQSSLM